MISGVDDRIDNASLLMIPKIADDIGNDVAVGTNREGEELIIPKSDYSPHRSSTQHRRGTLRVQSMFLLPP